jgi:hypothetical protein
LFDDLVAHRLLALDAIGLFERRGVEESDVLDGLGGVAMTLRMPARAAYRAQAAPALPLVGILMPSTPSSFARATPTAAPRALNEPVGMSDSSFMRMFASSARLNAGNPTSGVMPSPRLNAGSGSRTGRTSR